MVSETSGPDAGGGAVPAGAGLGFALGLAIVVRIHEAYGTIEEDEIHGQDQEAE